MFNLSLARSVSPTTRLIGRVEMMQRMKTKMTINLKTVPKRTIKMHMTVTMMTMLLHRLSQ